MLFTCNKTVEGHELRLEGTVDEIRSDADRFGDTIAGYDVTGVSIGQHDGARAHVFQLSDSMGQRSIGRLALRDDALRDARLEWVRSFDTVADAERFFDRFHNPPAPEPTDVISVQLDMSFDEPDPRRVLADWSAAYGVSFHVVQEFGPAAGNPVVEVSGYREMVVKWMKAEYVTEGTESVEFYLGESDS